jgi:hypothetical protein
MKTVWDQLAAHNARLARNRVIRSNIHPFVATRWLGIKDTVKRHS